MVNPFNLCYLVRTKNSKQLFSVMSKETCEHGTTWYLEEVDWIMHWSSVVGMEKSMLIAQWERELIDFFDSWQWTASTMDRDFPGQRLSLITQYNSFFYGPKSAKNVLIVTNMASETKWSMERNSERDSRELWNQAVVRLVVIRDRIVCLHPGCWQGTEWFAYILILVVVH